VQSPTLMKAYARRSTRPFYYLRWTESLLMLLFLLHAPQPRCLLPRLRSARVVAAMAPNRCLTRTRASRSSSSQSPAAALPGAFFGSSSTACLSFGRQHILRGSRSRQRQSLICAGAVTETAEALFSSNATASSPSSSLGATQGTVESPDAAQPPSSSTPKAKSDAAATNSKAGTASIPRAVLKRTRQSLAFRNGNPLVFAKAIDRLEHPNPKKDLSLGDLVEVVVPTDDGGGKGSKASSAAGQFTSLGFGVYNPDSLYRVRILCHRYLHPQLHRTLQALAAAAASSSREGRARDDDEAETQEDQRSSVASRDGVEAIVRHHLHTSLMKRSAIQLPNTRTNALRWVNGEGDSLSGLAVELLLLLPTSDDASQAPSSTECSEPTSFRAVAVVMSSAGWCQVHRASIERAIRSCLLTTSTTTDVVWKTTPSRLVQDGFTAEDVGQTSESTSQADQEPGSTRDGDSSVTIRENGVLFKVYPWSNGQKTSLYCDQRDNRDMVAQLCRNKRVLDLCCYHGGFALNALVNGGAASCTAVDSSQAAIDALQENVQLNKVDPAKVEAICSDITAFLQQACHGNPDRQYDVVVLDPPKLAPTASGLDKAKRKYHGLNRDAIKVVNEGQGGLLLTCTCSAAMTQKDGGRYFLDMVSGAALAANRCVTLLRVTGAASCHTQSPVAYPAGSYLTAALFYVHPSSEVNVDA
jgi:23S rRNA G2069 N7-methylase RlmK/C1962 C5-methylase RlmI